VIIDAHTRYAGFWRRTAALFIDTLLLSLMLSPIILYFGKVNLSLSIDSYQETELQDSLQSLLTVIALPDWLQYLFTLLFLALTVFLWLRYRGTPGKLLLGCRLVDANSGDTLRVGQAVLRNIAYLASLLPLGLGFLWVAWDKRKQGFHDKIAKTVVILDDPAQASLADLEKELR